MRQNRRARGRSGGRKMPNPLTRSYESNGPDVKVRGTASNIAEKYQQLARDALASGDPIAAENYYQHAEHYLRIIATAQAQQTQQAEERANEAGEDRSDDGRNDNRGEGRRNERGRGRTGQRAVNARPPMAMARMRLPVSRTRRTPPTSPACRPSCAMHLPPARRPKPLRMRISLTRRRRRRNRTMRLTPPKRQATVLHRRKKTPGPMKTPGPIRPGRVAHRAGVRRPGRLPMATAQPRAALRPTPDICLKSVDQWTPPHPCCGVFCCADATPI